jgi:hypothetical protein
MFKLATTFPAPGKAFSVYLPPHVLELVQPWAVGRLRSARLAAVVDRYRAIAAIRPDLTTDEWVALVRLVGPLATVGDISAAWARLLDRTEEDLLLPAAEAATLAGKIRELSLPEKVSVLEVADRVALSTGSWRERVVAALARKGP